MVEDTNSNEVLESRYKELFQLVPVSIWEDDFSELNVFLDNLKANGVTDFNEYFTEHPDFIFDIIRMIRIVNVNDYTLIMYEARDKAELLKSIENIFTQESLMTIKDAIIALVEEKPYFEGESTNRTLGGKMINVLIKIHYPEKPEQLKMVIISIIDITRIKELERLTRQESTITSVLAGLTSRFLEPLLSKQDICEMVLEYGQSLTSSENGLVLVFEESSLEIKAYASNGLAPSFIVSQKKSDKEDSIEKLINRNESCYTNDPGNDACMPDENMIEIAIKNFMHVPVIASSQLIGHIILANSTRDYNDDDICPIEQLAHAFTLAVLKSRAERRLQESETRYRDLVENQTEFIVRWRPDGQITFANNSYSIYFQQSQNMEVVKDFFSIFSLKQREKMQEWLESTTSDQQFFTIEINSVANENEITWQQWNHHALFDTKNNLLEIQSVGKDITEIKKYEIELGSYIRLEKLTSIISTNFINLPLDKIDAGIDQALSLMGQILEIDRCYIILFNEDYSSGTISYEWLAKNTISPIAKGDEIALQDQSWLVNRMLNKEVLETSELAGLRDNTGESMKPFLLESTRFFNIIPVVYNQQVIGFLVIEQACKLTIQQSQITMFLKLISEIISQALYRKNTESALHESENRYRSLFDNMSSGVAIFEAIEDGNDFIIKGFNKAAENIEHINAIEIIGKRITEVFPGIKQMGLMDVFRLVWNTGIQQFLPSTYYTDERISGWKENFVYQLSNGEIVTIYNDVTEKIKVQQLINEAEENLRKSEEKYRLITEESNDSISVVSREYKIQYTNEAYERLLGYKTNELIGKSGLGFIHPDDIKYALATFARLRGTGQEETTIELRLRHKDSHYIYFEVKAKNIIFNDIPGLLLIGRDITDRKISSAKLEDSEARYRLMLENASDMVTLLDEKLHIEYVNENAVKLLGFERQELIGYSVVDHIHPDDLTHIMETFREGFEHGEASGECRILHKDGHYIWFDVKGTGYLGKDGKRRALLLSRDISESKKMKEELLQLNQELEQRVEARTRDLKNAQEKLIRQEKLAAAGKISSTISHELRNPLAAISNSIYYLNMKLGNADEKIRKHVELIQAEVERSRQIITNLLDFTRIKQIEFSKVSLLSVIKDSLSHVIIPDGITIETENNADDVQLEIDPDLIQQVFFNIITNAIEAMPQGGNLSITIESDREQVTVKVKDSGVGISPENIQKLFEPLFTTKKSGIGLGLALVKDIIDKHNGKIEVDSNVGIGTEFRIFLPLMQNVG